VSVDLVLGALEYEAPLANPSPSGLYSAVTWVQDGGGEARFLGEGVRIRPHNYGAEDSVGVWDAPWCGEPGSGSQGAQLKFGFRPGLSEPFTSATVWAYDECDPTAASQAEVRTRAAQNLRLMEQTISEVVLSQRMLADATNVQVEINLRDALSYLEGQLAVTGTLGVVHANPELASQEFGLVVGNGPRFVTPLGHRWVFGGGYVDTLGNTLIATSPLYGWRTDAVIRDTFDQEHDNYIAIAERSVVIGYEKLIAAATFA
jgi:hypothetical protein